MERWNKKKKKKNVISPAALGSEIRSRESFKRIFFLWLPVPRRYVTRADTSFVAGLFFSQVTPITHKKKNFSEM